MKRKQLLSLMFAFSLVIAFSLGPTQARVPDRLLSSTDQPLAAPAADIIVTTTNDEMNNNGYCSLREAIQAANCDCPVDVCAAGSGGDIIWLDYETYVLDLVGAGEDGNQTGDLDIQGGSAIRIESWTSLTTVDGNATDRVFHVHPGAYLELVELTVRNGLAVGQVGGGIYNQGVLALDYVWVEDNVSTDPTEDGEGGGIFNDEGSVSIANSYIVDNHAVCPTAGCANGGGIRNWRGNVTIHASNIAGNTAEGGFGGGLSITSDADMTISRSWIGENESEHGGGIYCSGNLGITNSIIERNDAVVQGGGIFHLGYLLTVVDSTISGNTATDGGGLWISEETRLTNTTISGNSATTDGGGIYVDYFSHFDELYLTNVTLIDNGAGDEGGGLYAYMDWPDGGEIYLDNSIIALSPSGGDCVEFEAIFVNEGYSFIGDGSCGFPAGGDPVVGPLQDNGGPMAGLYESRPVETHALLPGSPAIDAGDCAGGTIEADQRGVERPQDGDGVGGAACDIGAYERHAVRPVLFDEAHDEWKTLDAARADELCPGIIPWCTEGDEDYVLYTDLRDNLSDEFTLVRNADQPLTDALLSQYNALMITINQAPLTPAEELAVRRYVAQGGGLVWIGDCGYGNDNPDLAAAFGLKFLPQCLFSLPYTGDLDGDLYDFRYPFHEASRFATDHYINWGSNLERLDTDVTARVAYTGPDVWEDTDDSGDYSPPPGGTDRAGEQFLVAAAYDENCGRVVALSDDAYSNMFLGGSNNEAYMRSLLRWVSDGYACELPLHIVYVPLVFKDYGH